MRLTIHQKLLIGFLTGALLLVGMATVSLVVVGQMHQRVRALEVAEERVDVARQMLYDVTSQSHLRAMALLRFDNHPHYALKYWNAKVQLKKAEFLEQLGTLKSIDPQNKYAEFYVNLENANRKYSNVGKRVDDALDSALEARKDGDSSTEDQEFYRAEDLHLNNEHLKSHTLEDMLSTCGTGTEAESSTIVVGPRKEDKPHKCGYLGDSLIDVTHDEMQKAVLDYNSTRRLYFIIVLAFTAVSVLLALLLGFLFSWPFLIPVKKMQRALAGMTAGDLRQRVAVPNRDEFGKLSQDLNTTSQRLESSFERQRSLAQRLRETNASLARASEAKASKLTLAPAPFQPFELVQSVVAEHRAPAAQKGIGLSYRDAGSPADVVQDPQRVRQILTNLIGNAVRLTEEGEVEVAVSAAADGLRVAVRDSGPGIPEGEREAIFQDFDQAHGSEPGTGLGLAISRRLARAMGGDITLQTREGHGSTFQLWLPRDDRTLTEGE